MNTNHGASGVPNSLEQLREEIANLQLPPEDVQRIEGAVVESVERRRAESAASNTSVSGGLLEFTASAVRFGLASKAQLLQRDAFLRKHRLEVMDRSVEVTNVQSNSRK